MYGEMKNCDYCGEEIKANLRRCPFCGSLLKLERNRHEKAGEADETGRELINIDFGANANTGVNTGLNVDINTDTNTNKNVGTDVDVDVNVDMYTQTKDSLSNGFKVFLTVISTVIPGFGQLIGIIASIVFMNSEDDSDRRSFGVALLIASSIMFVISFFSFIVIILLIANLNQLY